MLTVRVNPKRWSESLVLWPGAPELRRTSQTGSTLKKKLSRIPRHWDGRAGNQLEVDCKQNDNARDHHSSRGAQEHQPARGISLEIKRTH